MKQIRVIVPVITNLWNESVRKELEIYKDEDTRIEVVNILKGPESIECSYDVAWAELFALQESEKAEKAGCDGVIIYCFLEPGLRAAKEKLHIPVVGLAEAAVHLASLLGEKFSIITAGNQEGNYSLLYAKLKFYGFESKCVSIYSLGIPILELGKDKGRQAEKLRQRAKEVVLQDHADTIVLGCGSILGVEQQVSAELDIPIVVPGVAALKICEDLIKLKQSQSKACFRMPTEKKRVL